MSYYKNDFQVFKQKFNENELLSSKSTLIKDNRPKNGTIFITEEYFTYIREKEDFIYRIPLSDVNDFESKKKGFTNSIFLVYGKKYSNTFEIIDSQEYYFIITLLNLLVRINKEDNSIKKHKIKEIDIEINLLKNKENETNEKLELLSKRETEIVRLNSDYEDKLQSKNLVLSNLDKEIKRNNEKIFKQNREIENLQQLINGYKEEHYFKEILVNHFEDTLTSKDLTDKLTMINLDEKDYIKRKLAINYYGDSDTKRTIDSQSKQILRSFNTECDSLYLNVNSKNYEAYHKKISNAFGTLNRLYAIDSVEITRAYLKLKLEKLSLIHAKILKIEQEKEVQREIKAQMREEERVRREIENEKKKLEKEEKQFNNEVNLLLKRLEKAQNTVEAEIYAEKIRSLELKISELEKDKKNVLNRETNTRAGYVYIISNIGSFGENIYKIGMTRRLEPTERIKELGDASVPFEFDIHAMIFSDDAPKLEKTLHNHFRDRELNKVNHRKEFFNVHIDEIEKLVIQEYNNTVDFIKIPVADQYWESQRLNLN